MLDSLILGYFATVPIKILKSYRNDIEKHISLEQVDKMISELTTMLDKPYEVTCLECGTLIKANEDKCGTCGWSWETQPMN